MALDKLVDSTQLDADLTSVANAIRTKGGTSGQLAFPQGFVSAVEAIETGGGESGATVIASGTFVGNNGHNITIPIGTKMPQTGFVFQFWVDDGTEFPYNTSYKFAAGVLLALKEFAFFNLSSDGNKQATSQLPVNVNNDGTITAVNLIPVFFTHQTVLNNEIGATAAGWHRSQRVIRSATGFSIFLNQGNSVYTFPSSITYNWRLLYFGSDPQNDIVEVA